MIMNLSKWLLCPRYMNKEGNFKKLIRNLRTKGYAKLDYIRNSIVLNKGESSQKGKLQSDKNNNTRKE